MYSLFRIQIKWQMGIFLVKCMHVFSLSPEPISKHVHALKHTGKQTQWGISERCRMILFQQWRQICHIMMFLFCLLWCYHISILWYLLTTICSTGWLKIYSLHAGSYKLLFFKVKPKITKLVNTNVKIKKHILKSLTFSVYVRAPSVLILCDGILGSPVPRVFVAIIRNSYSIHGIKSITVADSMFPSISAGSKKKKD